MVRMRCGIAEDDEPAAALEKLHATLEEHLLDADDRAFVEPRLAQLLGLGDHETRERQELFGAWRLFFERLAETYPTVLAFEDMQWADSSLLDFIEYLLESSRSHPIFVVTLARPELAERRPTWGAGHRNFSSIYLEPLSESAMQELLGGLVPGLPATLRDQILARAEGIPLYAVETVRMLLDRGLLAEDALVVPRRRRSRVARDPGDAAGARRRAARHALGRRAPGGPGRRGARKDVHARRARCAHRARAGRARADARRARAQGVARACRPIRARPSTASTASCKT